MEVENVVFKMDVRRVLVVKRIDVKHMEVGDNAMSLTVRKVL
jgi:hypothetical protein